MSQSPFTIADPAERSRQRGPVATEAYLPEVAGASRSRKASTIDPIPAFFLMAHPGRWGVTRGKLRPDLGRMKLVPGISGVEKQKGGPIRANLARAHYEDRDWQIIPHNVLPPSEAHRGSYLCHPAGRRDVTLCYWQQVFSSSTALRVDYDLLDAFLDYIVEAGVIDAPEPHVVEKLLRQKESEFAKAADKAQTVPSFKVAAKRIEGEIKLLKKELARLDGDTSEPLPSTPFGMDEDEVEPEADDFGADVPEPAAPKRGRKTRR